MMKPCAVSTYASLRHREGSFVGIRFASKPEDYVIRAIRCSGGRYRSAATAGPDPLWVVPPSQLQAIIDSISSAASAVSLVTQLRELIDCEGAASVTARGPEDREGDPSPRTPVVRRPVKRARHCVDTLPRGKCEACAYEGRMKDEEGGYRQWDDAHTCG